MADYTTDLERYRTTLQQTANPYLEASKLALQRLQEGPGGVYSDDQFKQITDYYKAPVLDAAQNRQQQLSNYMRARGLQDSGAHTTALMEDFRTTEKQLAENIDVPLMMEQIRQKEAATQANIGQAAQVGLQGYEAFQAGQAQSLQERLARAQAVGQWDNQGTLQAQAQTFQQEILTRQQNLDELNAAVNRALMQANVTGEYVDPESGQSLQTLQAQAQQAQLDLAERSQTLQELEQSQAAVARTQGLQLTEAELLERRRQFDVSVDQQTDQFAASLGMSRDQFNESKRQFDAGLGLNNAQLEASIEQFNAGLREQRRQFDEQVNQRAGEFTATMGLSAEQFDEAIRQYDLGRMDQLTQMERQFNLQEGSLSEQIRQFDSEMSQRQTEFGLSQAELAERKRQFDSELAATERQFAANLGLSRDQFGETQRQFNEQVNQQAEQFAAELGLSVEQFNEARRQFDSGQVLQNRSLDESVRQFNAQYDQQAVQFAAQHGLDQAQFG